LCIWPITLKIRARWVLRFLIGQMVVLLNECGVYTLEQLPVWNEIIWVIYFQTLTHTFGLKFNMHFLKKEVNVNSFLMH
jgi:hypothetical protein